MENMNLVVASRDCRGFGFVGDVEQFHRTHSVACKTESEIYYLKKIWWTQNFISIAVVFFLELGIGLAG